MISAVLANTYAQKGGDLGDIERRVRSLWVGETVACLTKGSTSSTTTQCDTATRRRQFSSSLPRSVSTACRTCPAMLESECDPLPSKVLTEIR